MRTEGARLLALDIALLLPGSVTVRLLTGSCAFATALLAIGVVAMLLVQGSSRDGR